MDATNAGALAELIEDGRTGLLSPVGDAPMLARNVTALLRDRAAAQRLGGRAAAEARRARPWPQVVPAIAQVYRDVARTGRWNREGRDAPLGIRLERTAGACQDEVVDGRGRARRARG